MSLYCAPSKEPDSEIKATSYSTLSSSLSYLHDGPIIAHHQRFFPTVIPRISVSCEGKTAIGVASPTVVVPPQLV